jgi:TRAP-type C4-dicarboxylate transport system permease small subunit
VAVQALQNAVSEEKRRVMKWLVILCMLATTSFMLFYGIQLCLTTWHQSIAEFPGLSVGLTYTPIPIAGFITILFILEQALFGRPPEDSIVWRDGAAEVE